MGSADWLVWFRRATIVLLLLVHTLAWWWIQDLSTDSTVMVSFSDALPFGQMALLVIWSVLAVTALAGRLAAIVAAFFVLWGVRDFPAEILLVQAFLSLLLAAGARWSSWRLSVESSPSATSSQFSLRWLFVVTIIAAVVSGLVVRSRNLVTDDEPIERWLIYLSGGSISAVVALCACWCVLAYRYWPGWMLLGLAAAGLGGAMFTYMCRRTDDLWIFVHLMVWHAAIVMGSLLVLRSCGWRLSRRRAVPATGK